VSPDAEGDPDLIVGMEPHGARRSRPRRLRADTLNRDLAQPRSFEDYTALPVTG
jgi:hypothetical protein